MDSDGDFSTAMDSAADELRYLVAAKATAAVCSPRLKNSRRLSRLGVLFIGSSQFNHADISRRTCPSIMGCGQSPIADSILPVHFQSHSGCAFLLCPIRDGLDVF